MGATRGPKDNFIYFPFKLTPFEEAQITMQFDLACDLDEKDIEELKKEIKFLRKVCSYKVIMFPFEWLITRIMFGKEEAKNKKNVTLLYWSYLRNKITIEKFGKQLAFLVQSGKVL